MSKNQKNWWERELPKDVLEEFLNRPRMQQLMIDVLTGRWLPSESQRELWTWEDALCAIDKRDDHRPLLELLKTCVPAQVVPHIVDLFDRRQLTLKRGKSRSIPNYDWFSMTTGPESKLRLAKETIALLVEGYRVTLKDALKQTAERQGIPLKVLTNAYRGRRGSSRRKKSAAAQ
jgi:hypothetical protein